MPNVTTSISKYWHEMASRKGIRWSIALTVGIKTLLHESLEEFGNPSKDKVLEVNRKLLTKIKELENVLDERKKS